MLDDFKCGVATLPLCPFGQIYPPLFAASSHKSSMIHWYVWPRSSHQFWVVRDWPDKPIKYPSTIHKISITYLQHIHKNVLKVSMFPTPKSPVTPTSPPQVQKRQVVWWGLGSRRETFMSANLDPTSHQVTGCLLPKFYGLKNALIGFWKKKHGNSSVLRYDSMTSYWWRKKQNIATKIRSCSTYMQSQSPVSRFVWNVIFSRASKKFNIQHWTCSTNFQNRFSISRCWSYTIIWNSKFYSVELRISWVTQLYTRPHPTIIVWNRGTWHAPWRNAPDRQCESCRCTSGPGPVEKTSTPGLDRPSFAHRINGNFNGNYRTLK